MNIDKQIATLAFCSGTYDYAEKIKMKPGRVKSQLKALKKEADRLLKNYESPIYDGNVNQAIKMIDGWGDVSGWDRKNRKIQTVISFLCDLVGEAFPGSKLNEILEDLFHYYDRAGNVPAPSCWSGGVSG